MCNISGYIGNRPAAPVLIEMMKRQEGYCGGYYTGITTLHEGKLYHRKVMGDVDNLLKETDAINFPGTVGVIHSRSKSGGDWHWGHPFVSYDDKFSVVVNGATGRYEPLGPCATKMAAFLDGQGVKFETETPYSDKLKIYPRIPNGNSVHTSEVICHLAHYYIEKNGLPSYLALEKTFLDIPKEIVALSMHADEAGAISFAKMNMPMAIARTDDEVFLSSFSICFPEDRSYNTLDELPQESSGVITLDKTVIRRFSSPITMGRMTPKIMHDAYDIIVNALKKEGPLSIGKLNRAVAVLWGDKVNLRYLATYGVLRSLYDDGRIEIVKKECEGMTPEYKTNAFTLKLK